MIEVFGIAFSIMGLLPSIASTLAYSIPAGPVGMVWVSLWHSKGLCQKIRLAKHWLGLVSGLGLYICSRVSNGDRSWPSRPTSRH